MTKNLIHIAEAYYKEIHGLVRTEVQYYFTELGMEVEEVARKVMGGSELADSIHYLLCKAADVHNLSESEWDTLSEELFRMARIEAYECFATLENDRANDPYWDYQGSPI